MKALGNVGASITFLIGAVVGIASGWFLGSWTAYATGLGCELRLQAVVTAVAFISEIGTFAMLLIGLVKFSQDGREKTRNTVRDSRRSAIRMRPIGHNRGQDTYSKIQIEVTNQTAKEMMNIAFVLDRG